MKSKVAELFGASLALEAVEFLAVNFERVADSGFPTENGMKNFIEIVQLQKVRNSYESDYHRVHVTENRSKDQSFEKDCRPTLIIYTTPDFVLLSTNALCG